MNATRRFNPTLEALEDRLAQTTASLSGGILSVYGTNASETIAIRQVNNVIRINGVAQGYAASQVQGIVVDGKAGNDQIYLSNPTFENGVQYIYKPTLMLGGAGNDAIWGGAGNDLISGGAGNDRIYGMWGNDVLGGNDGADLINGGSGNDRLYGGQGADELYGESGNDLLDGGLGSDWLFGGSGQDYMWGGADYDSDVFVIDASDSLFPNYGEDYWYAPEYEYYYSLPSTQTTYSSTSALGSTKGILESLVGADNYRYFQKVGGMPNMFAS